MDKAAVPWFVSKILSSKFRRVPSSSKKKLNLRKIKRGKRKSKIKQKASDDENTMFILGGNSAGLLNKKESFLRNVSLFKPAAYFIQETKFTKKNKIQVDDYVIFENIRNRTGGGGIMTGSHHSHFEDGNGENPIPFRQLIPPSRVVTPYQSEHGHD